MTLTVTKAKTTLTTSARQSHRFDLEPDEAHRIDDGRTSAPKTFIVDHIWVLADGKNGDTLDFVDDLEVYAKGFADGDRSTWMKGNYEFSRHWHGHIGFMKTQFCAMPTFIADVIRERTALGDLLDHAIANPKFYLNDPDHPEYARSLT